MTFKLAHLTAIIARELEKSADSISASTTLEDLGIDSLEFIELLQAIEDEMGRVPDHAIAHIETVGDIVKYLP